MANGNIPPDTSASQLVTWVMCPRKYLFRYVLGFTPEFRSVNLVLGSAFHSAIGWFFGELLHGKTPKLATAEEVFDADFFSEVSEGNVRWGKKSEDEVASEGRALVGAYLAKFSDLPVVAVEQPFHVSIKDPETGETLPRAFKGRFDLVIANHTIVKMETTTRRWNPQDLFRHLQVGAYVAAKCMLDGGPATVAVHVVVKTKTPQVQEHRTERGEYGNRWWFRAASDIEWAILGGHFPPIPGPLCHECEFARSCERWTGEMLPERARNERPVHRLPIAQHSAP